MGDNTNIQKEFEDLFEEINSEKNSPAKKPVTNPSPKLRSQTGAPPPKRSSNGNEKTAATTAATSAAASTSSSSTSPPLTNATKSAEIGSVIANGKNSSPVESPESRAEKIAEVKRALSKDLPESIFTPRASTIGINLRGDHKKPGMAGIDEDDSSDEDFVKKAQAKHDEKMKKKDPYSKFTSAKKANPNLVSDDDDDDKYKKNSKIKSPHPASSKKELKDVTAPPSTSNTLSRGTSLCSDPEKGDSIRNSQTSNSSENGNGKNPDEKPLIIDTNRFYSGDKTFAKEEAEQQQKLVVMVASLIGGIIALVIFMQMCGCCDRASDADFEDNAERRAKRKAMLQENGLSDATNSIVGGAAVGGVVGSTLDNDEYDDENSNSHRKGRSSRKATKSEEMRHKKEAEWNASHKKREPGIGDLDEKPGRGGRGFSAEEPKNDEEDDAFGSNEGKNAADHLTEEAKTRAAIAEKNLEIEKLRELKALKERDEEIEELKAQIKRDEKERANLRHGNREAVGIKEKDTSNDNHEMESEAIRKQQEEINQLKEQLKKSNSEKATTGNIMGGPHDAIPDASINPDKVSPLQTITDKISDKLWKMDKKTLLEAGAAVAGVAFLAWEFGTGSSSGNNNGKKKPLLEEGSVAANMAKNMFKEASGGYDLPDGIITKKIPEPEPSCCDFVVEYGGGFCVCLLWLFVIGGLVIAIIAFTQKDGLGEDWKNIDWKALMNGELPGTIAPSGRRKEGNTRNNPNMLDEDEIYRRNPKVDAVFVSPRVDKKKQKLNGISMERTETQEAALRELCGAV